MVVVAAIFSQSSAAGAPIYVGPTIMTLALFAGWWIFSFAAMAHAAGSVIAFFRRQGLRAVWGHLWRAALLKLCSMVCCLVFNTWVLHQ